MYNIYLIIFPDCFSIVDYKDCEKLRQENSSFANAIYHNGSCINDPIALGAIRNNFSHFYKGKTKVVLEDVGEKMVDCTYVNASYCSTSWSSNDGSLELFDIPPPLRKTGKLRVFIPKKCHQTAE